MALTVALAGKDTFAEKVVCSTAVESFSLFFLKNNNNVVILLFK